MGAFISVPWVVVQFKISVVEDLQLFLSHNHLCFWVDSCLATIPVHDRLRHLSRQVTVRHKFYKFHLDACYLLFLYEIQIVRKVFCITENLNTLNFYRRWLFFLYFLYNFFLFWLDNFISTCDTYLEKFFLQFYKMLLGLRQKLLKIKQIAGLPHLGCILPTKMQ